MAGSATGSPWRMRRLTELRVQWSWILLAAGAVLLLAAGYVLLSAVRVAQDWSSLTGGLPESDGSAEPAGLAERAAAVMQFSGHIPALLVLLAVMLLAGCLALTGALPTTVRGTGGGNAQPAGGSRLRLGLLALATVAGLLALTYAATAALALTFYSPLVADAPPGVRSILRSNSITVLAISFAALVLLAPVFLSRWVSGHPPASPDVQDEQDSAASLPRRPAPETPEADAPQPPPSAPPDLIEGPRLNRGR